ncbi:MAG TPA: FAD-containing oxidoreductase [Candidatus Acidoferrum sp.]|nr:FAD-containing oxidoreductase [Candidatus Acidoferrum sp.]
MSSRWKWVLYATAAVALVLALKYFHVQDLLKAALDWIGKLGPWGPVIFVGLYVVATVLFIPGSVLTLGAGAVFGVALGSACVSISATLGATAAFLVGRYLARDAIARKIEKNDKFAAIDRAVADEGWKIVLLTRLVPVFPFTLLNYAFSLTRVKLSHYVLASWIGMMPGTVMYVYFGSLVNVGAGHRQRTTGEWILYGVGLLAAVTVTVFVTRLARKALAKRIGTDETVQNPKGIMSAPSEPVLVRPADAHNARLLSHVHPPGWQNPAPAPRYNLVVIGAGTAGLVTAAGAAGLGAKVALVEKHLLGGDCLNVGCVPSKAVIRSSRALFDANEAGRFGVRVNAAAKADFPAVMERMRKLRADLSPTDSAQRFTKLGVDVFLGEARFAGPDTIQVAGQTVRFKTAVIATGARATDPPIPGLTEAGYLTNETVFNLTQCPTRLAIIGGGPIGCELAQAFQRMGSQISLLHRNAHLLDREDMDAAALVQKAFVREGVALHLNAKITRVERNGGAKVICYEAQGKEERLAVDEILAGAGRAPNVEGLNLESVGVQYDLRKGVLVNDCLQTTNPRIYAAGDVCMAWKFTHAADFTARIVIQNALFLGRKKVSALTMPWCTYTDPEIAHVGLYERDARERGVEVDTYAREFKDVDRAVLDGEEEGFVKFHVRKGDDEILGATIVARHAGEMISEISVAMAAHIGLGKLASVIHPYPTQTEALRQCGDAYNRTRLTPTVKKWMGRWLSWQRG